MEVLCKINGVYMNYDTAKNYKKVSKNKNLEIEFHIPIPIEVK